MKNIKIMVILTTTIIFATNCTKQNNCDCGYEGKFVYYEEPLKMTDVRHGNPDLDAQFFVLHADSSVTTIDIQGYIPRKFRTKDTINVRCCLEIIHKGLDLTDLHFCPSKIKCIERIE